MASNTFLRPPGTPRALAYCIHRYAQKKKNTYTKVKERGGKGRGEKGKEGRKRKGKRKGRERKGREGKGKTHSLQNQKLRPLSTCSQVSWFLQTAFHSQPNTRSAI